LIHGANRPPVDIPDCEVGHNPTKQAQRDQGRELRQKRIRACNWNKLRGSNGAPRRTRARRWFVEIAGAASLPRCSAPVICRRSSPRLRRHQRGRAAPSQPPHPGLARSPRVFLDVRGWKLDVGNPSESIDQRSFTLPSDVNPCPEIAGWIPFLNQCLSVFTCGFSFW